MYTKQVTLAAVIVGLFGVSFIVSVSPADAQLKYTACLKEKNGKLKGVAIGDSASKPCKKNETEVMFPGPDAITNLQEQIDLLGDRVDALDPNGGGGNGIIAVAESEDYVDFCKAGDAQHEPGSFLKLTPNCPAGKVLIGQRCASDIPAQSASVGWMILRARDGVHLSWSNETGPVPEIPQYFLCGLSCLTGAGGGISGTLTGTALCVEPPAPSGS